jgi:hypothetical protein
MPRSMGFVRMKEGSGLATLHYDTLEEALVGQREFADLHAKHWAECSMVATLRQISEGPPPAADA